MTIIDFDMKYKSENDNSVIVSFCSHKVINLLINNIQFLYEDEEADNADASYSIPVLLNASIVELPFPYPKNRSASYHSVRFNIHDYSQNLDFQVVIKYDEDALPDIRVL